MFEGIINFFKKSVKKEEKQLSNNSKSAAKERLHLVLMQDRANVSADFLELMKQEIIEVIKKYIEVDEEAIDVRLTNQSNEDGTNGAPALYANIPIMNIKNESRKITNPNKEENGKEEKNTENTEDTEVKKQEKEIEPKTEPKEEKINKNTSKPKKDVESEKIEQEKE